MAQNVLSHVTNGIQEFVKCCMKSSVHLDLWPNNMLYGRLQPEIKMKSIMMHHFINSLFGLV